MESLNNKGFTLVELLAVLVILAAIMGIAIPSITSSMERTKTKQNEEKKAMLESFAELYVADHKNTIYSNIGSATSCYISLSTLKDSGYLTNDADKDADGNQLNGHILFVKAENSYNYIENIPTGVASCN